MKIELCSILLWVRGRAVVAARDKGKIGIGFEISKEFIHVARIRLKQPSLLEIELEPKIIQADARQIGQYLEPHSVDLCITSRAVLPTS